VVGEKGRDREGKIGMNHYYQRIPGWFFWPEAFDRIVAGLPVDRPSTVVVLGVWAGRSTAYLGVEIVNSVKPVSLVCVDTFRGTSDPVQANDPMLPHLERIFRANLSPVARLLGARFSVVVGDSVKTAKLLGAVDAVWVDAGQEVKQVMGDIEAWWPKLRIGGMMGGCDYDRRRVRRAVKRRFGEMMPFHDGVGDPYSKWWLVRR
jgi:hypothetical protein